MNLDVFITISEIYIAELVAFNFCLKYTDLNISYYCLHEKLAVEHNRYNILCRFQL